MRNQGGEKRGQRVPQTQGSPHDANQIQEAQFQTISVISIDSALSPVKSAFPAGSRIAGNAGEMPQHDQGRRS
jgi:hypothetical protein